LAYLVKRTNMAAIELKRPLAAAAAADQKKEPERTLTALTAQLEDMRTRMVATGLWKDEDSPADGGWSLVHSPQKAPVPPPGKAAAPAETKGASRPVHSFRQIALKRGIATGRQNSNRPIRLESGYSGTSNSSANTALQINAAVSPASTDDWAAMAGLFDEVRVMGGYVKWVVTCNADSVRPDANIAGVCAFDPTTATSLATLGEGLVARYHHAFVLPGKNAGPTPTSRDGFHTMKWRNPHVAVRNTTSTALTQGWMSTSDGADIFGYVKFLLAAAGSSNITSITYYIVLDMEFRSRQ
jgi:hypothetical protein